MSRPESDTRDFRNLLWQVQAKCPRPFSHRAWSPMAPRSSEGKCPKSNLGIGGEQVYTPRLLNSASLEFRQETANRGCSAIARSAASILARARLTAFASMGKMARAWPLRYCRINNLRTIMAKPGHSASAHRSLSAASKRARSRPATGPRRSSGASLDRQISNPALSAAHLSDGGDRLRRFTRQMASSAPGVRLPR